jgi:hypothetical protein
VVGLAWKPLDLPDLGVGPAVLLAIGEPTPRGELTVAREELDVLVEHGRRMGLRGRLQADDYLLETLLGRSPRLAARLKDKVLASLSDDDHGELAQTLQTSCAAALTARPQARRSTSTATRWPTGWGESRRSPGSTSAAPATSRAPTWLSGWALTNRLGNEACCSDAQANEPTFGMPSLSPARPAGIGCE